MREVGSDACCVDKVGVVVFRVGVASGVRDMVVMAAVVDADADGVGFPDVVVDEVDEFTEDGELELEFDAVDDALEHGFHDVLVHVLDDEQAEVHDDDDEVDSDELVHDLALAAVRIEAQHADGFPDVEGGDDEFLYTEAGHLDLLHHVVAADVGRGVDGAGHVGAVGQHGGGNVEDDGIDEDHGEDAAQDAWVAHDQVQARIEDDGLAGDHAPPADGDEGDG